VRGTLAVLLLILFLSASIQVPVITANNGENTGNIVTSTLYIGAVDRAFFITWVKHLQAQPYSAMNIYINYSPGYINTVMFGNMYFRKNLVNPDYYVVAKVTTKTISNRTMMYFEIYIQYLNNNTLKQIGNAEIIIRNTENSSTIISAELSSNNNCLLKYLTYVINTFIASPLRKQVSKQDLIRAVDRPRTIISSAINATFYLNGTIEGLLQENTTKLQSFGCDLTYNIIYSYPNKTINSVGLDLQMFSELYVLIENDTGDYATYIMNIIDNAIYNRHDLSLEIHCNNEYFDLYFDTTSNNLTLDHWNSVIYTILTADGYSYESIKKLFSKLGIIENDLAAGNLGGAEKILHEALGEPVFNTSEIIDNQLSMYKMWSNLSLAFNLISTQNGSLYILPDGRLINMTVKSITVKPYPTPLDAVVIHMILNNRRVLPQIATKPKPTPIPPSPAGMSTTMSPMSRRSCGENITINIPLSTKPRLPKPTIANWYKHDLTPLLILLGVIGGIIIIIYIDKKRRKNR